MSSFGGSFCASPVSTGTEFVRKSEEGMLSEMTWVDDLLAGEVAGRTPRAYVTVKDGVSFPVLELPALNVQNANPGNLASFFRAACGAASRSIYTTVASSPEGVVEGSFTGRSAAVCQPYAELRSGDGSLRPGDELWSPGGPVSPFSAYDTPLGGVLSKLDEAVTKRGDTRFPGFGEGTCYLSVIREECKARVYSQLTNRATLGSLVALGASVFRPSDELRNVGVSLLRDGTVLHFQEGIGLGCLSAADILSVGRHALASPGLACSERILASPVGGTVESVEPDHSCFVGLCQELGINAPADGEFAGLALALSMTSGVVRVVGSEGGDTPLHYRLVRDPVADPPDREKEFDVSVTGFPSVARMSVRPFCGCGTRVENAVSRVADLSIVGAFPDSGDGGVRSRQEKPEASGPGAAADAGCAPGLRKGRMAAWFGDARHTLDVRNALCRAYGYDKAVVAVSEYSSRRANQAYLLAENLIGVQVGIDLASEVFEASYDALRPDYVAWLCGRLNLSSEDTACVLGGVLPDGGGVAAGLPRPGQGTTFAGLARQLGSALPDCTCGVKSSIPVQQLAVACCGKHGGKSALRDWFAGHSRSAAYDHLSALVEAICVDGGGTLAFEARQQLPLAGGDTLQASGAFVGCATEVLASEAHPAACLAVVSEMRSKASYSKKKVVDLLLA